MKLNAKSYIRSRVEVLGSIGSRLTPLVDIATVMVYGRVTAGKPDRCCSGVNWICWVLRHTSTRKNGIIHSLPLTMGHIPVKTRASMFPNVCSFPMVRGFDMAINPKS